MRTLTIFVMLSLVVTATAAADGESNNATNTVPKDTKELPKEDIAHTRGTPQVPEEMDGSGERTDEKPISDVYVPTGPSPSAESDSVNDGGNPLAESSEEATSMTSGGNIIGGFAAFASALIYLF